MFQKLALVPRVSNKDVRVITEQKAEGDYSNVKRLQVGLGALLQLGFELTNLSEERFHLEKGSEIVIVLTFFRSETI